MITSIDELKELIIWAKSQKLKSLKVGEVIFEFSDLGLIESLPDLSAPPSQARDLSVPASSPRVPQMGDEQLSEKEFEAILFHSTR